jgi:hypothetical protein
MIVAVYYLKQLKTDTMKKQLFKVVSVKAYATALFTSAILLISFTSAKASESPDTVRQSQVTYLGLKGDLIGFNVNFDNTTSNKFVLELTDGEGRILFAKKFSEKNFNRNIYLKNVGDDDKTKVQFTIVAGNKVYKESFDINTKKTFVQDFVVTRL